MCGLETQPGWCGAKILRQLVMGKRKRARHACQELVDVKGVGGGRQLKMQGMVSFFLFTLFLTCSIVS